MPKVFLLTFIDPQQRSLLIFADRYERGERYHRFFYQRDERGDVFWYSPSLLQSVRELVSPSPEEITLAESNRDIWEITNIGARR